MSWAIRVSLERMLSQPLTKSCVMAANVLIKGCGPFSFALAGSMGP